MHQPARMIERGVWAWLIGCVLWCAGWSSAWAQVNQAEVTHLHLERNEDGIVLSATVQFDLPPAVDDALT